MNLSILKTAGFWITAIPTLLALATTSGIVLNGSIEAQVGAWILAILGMVTGHTVQAAPAAPAATPAA
jgi:hypothetical protein